MLLDSAIMPLVMIGSAERMSGRICTMYVDFFVTTLVEDIDT